MIPEFYDPIFVGNIFQRLYSMADTVIVGKFVGNEALAAVGACGTLMFLIIIPAWPYSRIYGDNGAALWGGEPAGHAPVRGIGRFCPRRYLILTILSMAMMKDILRWMHTPADMYGQAYGYIMVICGGIAAQTFI